MLQSIDVRPSAPDVKPYTERHDGLRVPVPSRRLAPTPRKLRVIGRDVSVRMEQHRWDDFEHISAAIKASPSELARRIVARTAGVYGPTAAIREFILRYWRSAAEMPHVDAEARVRAVLWHLGAPPQDQMDGVIIRLQDTLAPHLTPGRVEMIAAQSRVDLGAFAAQVRAAWGGDAPWQSGQDGIAGRVLEALVPFAAADSRAG
ncbi:ribbon-helix-helix domain-containing protein [Azospirillum canadense]|uniref:ribbon-helix-helix domain-containing protein n=1 Tax=Azospirillum canadense TaxID=403962 RepID=UPI002226B315|nr:ribbon-helix-helix domain-containing protein [Azospirillum canadense]MCW2240704.1 putative DNA-binding ribbon-helix-helix protein [Azospirillum canadense]